MKLLISIFFALQLVAQPTDSIKVFSSNYNIEEEIITVNHIISDQKINFVYNHQMFAQRCDTLPQVKFWRKIMQLHKDSALFNVHENRKVLCKVNYKSYDSLKPDLKNRFKDSLRFTYLLSDSARILLTSGKSFFYDFEKASANFDQGIKGFVANGVDPWYAQAILLIESPNKLQKSNAGAYGSFQLMKDVARLFGLKVNKNIDERADFDRSAYAASSLIKKICVPNTRKILDSLGITNYKENELWFRLLVMHAYHAGSGNVRKALFTFMPKQGDMNLIYNLWHTETNHFKTASQNYSQLVLAAMIEVHENYSLNPYQENNLNKGVLKNNNPN